MFKIHKKQWKIGLTFWEVSKDMIESYLQDKQYKIQLYLISGFFAIKKKRDGSMQQIQDYNV